MTRGEHLLQILGEECVEVAQRASKALRFGISEVQPDQPGDLRSNADRLVAEYADILGAMEKLVEEGHIVLPSLRPLINAKKRKIDKFLEYSKKCGTLQEEAPR